MFEDVDDVLACYKSAAGTACSLDDDCLSKFASQDQLIHVHSARNCVNHSANDIGLTLFSNNMKLSLKIDTYHFLHLVLFRTVVLFYSVAYQLDREHGRCVILDGNENGTCGCVESLNLKGEECRPCKETPLCCINRTL